MSESKRRRIVKISEELIRTLWTTDDDGVWSSSKLMRVLEGLPKGARFRGCYDEPQYGNVCFVYEHESFEEVEEGGVPLSMPIVFQVPDWGLYSALKRLYAVHCGSPRDKEDWALVAEAFGLEK